MIKKIILGTVSLLIAFIIVAVMVKPTPEKVAAKPALNAKDTLKTTDIIHITDNTALRKLVTDGQANAQRPNDFLPLDNGTVLDKATGLQWMRCSLGQQWTGSTCSEKPTQFLFTELTQVAANFADYNDWRLPSFLELATITHCRSGKLFKSNAPDPEFALPNCSGEHKAPAIDSSLFPNTGDFANYIFSYWTTDTTSHYDKKGAWIIDFSDPFSTSELQANKKHAVRLVRRVK